MKSMVKNRSSLLLFLSLIFLSSVSVSIAHEKVQGVTYDGRSLIINGKRELVFSGAIHYPRSTPEQWPKLIDLAKRGGLNAIETYVFWNIHEPVQGQFNFEGQYDIVKFIKLAKEHDMNVMIRLGPFIQAEWNNGGLPFWLREVPGIIFRSDNEPFKTHMHQWITKVIEMLRAEKLFAPQGGPIFLAQIENEYNTIQLAYREKAHSYIQWAANLALSYNVGVPWVMCKQRDAPGPVINTCNGRHCGDTFTGPNAPNKPALWTENWTAQFRVWGDPPSQRAAEDIAMSVARWFSKNGSLTNYYMYHGGTNFGRTSAHFVTTRYYDEAPLDEFGLQREPKWSHLKDLHKALNLAKKPLLNGVSRPAELLAHDVEARVYEAPGMCVAFVANNASGRPITVKFRDSELYLPSKSISILPDCKTVVFNSQSIASQHNSRNFDRSAEAHQRPLVWETYREVLPAPDTFIMKSKSPMEFYGLTKDTTDYAWYSTSIDLGWRDLPFRENIKPVLVVASLGHALSVFVNGKYFGQAHGNHVEKSFVFEKPIELIAGTNHILLLAQAVGYPDSGAYMEKRFAGPRSVEILGLNTGTLDLTNNNWGQKVDLEGEKTRVYTQGGSHRVQWTRLDKPRPALSWYKTYFNPPPGDEPVALRMPHMGKGLIWVNGKCIGRHWLTFLSPLGHPTQSEYHVPRSFLKSSDNFLVILDEEENIKPEDIEIVTVNRDTICSYIHEGAPPPVSNWEIKGGVFRQIGDGKTAATLKCPNHKTMMKVEFASFGSPIGACGNFILGNCTSSISQQVVEKNCIGKQQCVIPIDRALFDDKKPDPCAHTRKVLAVQIRCAHK